MVADHSLSQRLERAEGNACVQAALARQRLFPNCGADWNNLDGTYVVFDGPISPLTQGFGFGLFAPPSEATLDAIEHFYFEHGAPVQLELSPHAGVSALEILCERGYGPVEISNVLYQPIVKSALSIDSGPPAYPIGPGQASLFAEINLNAWTHDYPDFADFLREAGAIVPAREGTACFLADWEGIPSATGALCIHEGVALFGGAATLPEVRRRGLQTALLNARMRFAADEGCDLAMIVAQPGSRSQRNAERQGFQIAYTRIKWMKNPPAE